ncbi:MAG: hypothetical protein WCH65_07425 [bacterium]
MLLISFIMINYYIYSLFGILLWNVFTNIFLILGVFIAELIIVS